MRPAGSATAWGKRAAGGVALLVVALSVVAPVTPAGATAVTLVRVGAETSTTSTSIAPTITATTSGDLVVAAVTVRANCVTITGPSGWTQAVRACISTGTTAIWYRPNSPSITTATFSWTGTAVATANLSEWSAAATTSVLDKTGTVTVTSAASTATVSTTGTVNITGELAVTSFVTGTTGMSSLTGGSGWTHQFTDTSRGSVTDYKTAVAAGSLSETETSSTATTWVGVIATFNTASCNGGTLGITPPASVSFPAVTLNGADKSTTTAAAVTVDDETGSGTGWQIQGTSTTFTSGANTLPTTATAVTGAFATAGSGNCSLPTNTVTYPLTLPAGSTAPTAVKLYNASALTGQGPVNVFLTVSLTVPGSARVGSYSSTWTISVASGP